MRNDFLKLCGYLLAQSTKHNPISISKSAAHQFHHLRSHSGTNSPSPTTLSPVHRFPGQSTPRVGIFWDLENKPPKSVSPYEAATKLKKAAASLGVVRHQVAYANRHALSYVPPRIIAERTERHLLNQLETRGVIRPKDAYKCGVCGRRFYTNEKLLNHFKIHELEHGKRMRQIDAAKGRKRVELVGKYAMKMEKYENVTREILAPKVGYGLGEDLKRAGFWVKKVEDRFQAADCALRRDVVEMMDLRRVDCVVLVSDDSDFVGVLREAKERCLKTVVIGDEGSGVLKRNGDAWFSWREILVGKAKKEGGNVVGRWRDGDVLKRLEWSYTPEMGKSVHDFRNCNCEDDACSEVDGVEDLAFVRDDNDDDDGLVVGKDDSPWWKLN